MITNFIKYILTYMLQLAPHGALSLVDFVSQEMKLFADEWPRPDLNLNQPYCY